MSRSGDFSLRGSFVSGISPFYFQRLWHSQSPSCDTVNQEKVAAFYLNFSLPAHSCEYLRGKTSLNMEVTQCNSFFPRGIVLPLLPAFGHFPEPSNSCFSLNNLNRVDCCYLWESQFILFLHYWNQNVGSCLDLFDENSKVTFQDIDRLRVLFPWITSNKKCHVPAVCSEGSINIFLLRVKSNESHNFLFQTCVFWIQEFLPAGHIYTQT